jgi:hypothetical protein
MKPPDTRLRRKLLNRMLSNQQGKGMSQVSEERQGDLDVALSIRGIHKKEIKAFFAFGQPPDNLDHTPLEHLHLIRHSQTMDVGPDDAHGLRALVYKNSPDSSSTQGFQA